MFGLFKQQGFKTVKLTEMPETIVWNHVWKQGKLSQDEIPVTQINVKYLDGLPKNKILAPRDANDLLYVTNKKFIPNNFYLAHTFGHIIKDIPTKNVNYLSYENGLATLKLNSGKEFRFMPTSKDLKYVKRVFQRIANECDFYVMFDRKSLK